MATAGWAVITAAVALEVIGFTGLWAAWSSAERRRKGEGFVMLTGARRPIVAYCIAVIAMVTAGALLVSLG